ncbi:MAG: hypothetical protein RIG26_14345 [Thalassospira sp.]|uniref:hypothetical protein n=1 Tax=Thalassospira sp. TaxID=1912094 RepID=UPI0032EAC228
MKAEAEILVRFQSASEGGRTSPIFADRYGCTLTKDGAHGFDCRFILDGLTLFEFGREYEVAVKFLNPENALESLKEGEKFYVWEGKIIGSGKVLAVHFNSSGNE